MDAASLAAADANERVKFDNRFAKRWEYLGSSGDGAR
jgi:hypothetical protein